MHKYSEYGLNFVNQWTLMTLNGLRNYNTQNAIRPIHCLVRHLRPKLAKPPSLFMVMRSL